ncbi:MGMT family protein [Russula compacta]|nr:MGMT family protein [Russula compacta]
MTLDSAEFHEAVYGVVRQIPRGKVTTYGHVAKLVGMPSYSRHVGQALKYLSPTAAAAAAADPDPPVPWQRVISSAGKISSRGPGTDGAQRQREALEDEDVEVRVGRANDELLVDLAAYGWFPAAGTVGWD